MKLGEQRGFHGQMGSDLMKLGEQRGFHGQMGRTSDNPWTVYRTPTLIFPTPSPPLPSPHPQLIVSPRIGGKPLYNETELYKCRWIFHYRDHGQQLCECICFRIVFLKTQKCKTSYIKLIVDKTTTNIRRVEKIAVTWLLVSARSQPA